MLFLLQMAFICGFCGTSLKTKDTLRQHENRHRNVRKYNCESCGKVSFSKANAEMHAASHREEKRLTCMNCQSNLLKPAHKKGNGHRQKNSTVEHATRNSAKSDLQDHLTTHTQTARHRCEECGKMFRYSSGLSRHRTTKHKE